MEILLFAPFGGGIERGFGAPRGCRRDQGRGSSSLVVTRTQGRGNKIEAHWRRGEGDGMAERGGEGEIGSSWGGGWRGFEFLLTSRSSGKVLFFHRY